MLKAAQRQKLTKLSNKHQLTSTPKRNVTSYYPWEMETIQNRNRRDFFDFNLARNGHLGILKMNREHRYNMLTPNYVKELKRAVNSMDIDDNVKFIYMIPQKGEHFSNGTDFRTLLHYKNENNQQAIADYLNGLYDLQTTLAKLNKPLMAVGPGHAFNSGAALLQTTAFPVMTLDSKISFNETTFGFIPHAGSTYFLSRLPGELGTFLGLTGYTLQGREAAELSIVDDIIHKVEHYDEYLADVVASLDFPIPNGELLSDRGRANPWQKHLKQKFQVEKENMLGDYFEMERQKRRYMSGEEFAEPKDMTISQTAESEYKYKQEMRKFNDAQSNHELGYFEFNNKIYQNYFSLVMDSIKVHAGQDFSFIPNSLKQHLTLIDRCFYPNTLEEIIENLRQEQDPFAQQVLKKMEQNSQLSMKITLKMLRNAKNQDYKGILESEMNIALNKIQDKEFEMGVKEVLLKPTNVDKNPGFSKNVSEDQVNSYFQEHPHKSEVNVNIVSNALLPTRFYYQKFSDQVRLWINEESTTLSEVRECFDMEVKEALRDHGIDIRDRALTQESARNALYDLHRFQRKEEEFNQRLTQLLKDEKLREKYYNNITAEIDKLDHNTEDFYKIVNKKIQGIFEQAYVSKLAFIFEKSKEAWSLEKRRMFIRLKKFLFESRILTYTKEEIDRLVKQSASMPFKEIHLTEKWDQSFREMEYPGIQKSFMWHISKAIGKRNITPVELTKQFLTDPKKVNMMQLYTFDKEELLKLRRDVLENPEKYEEVLRQQKLTFDPRKSTFDLDYRFENREVKRAEFEYWYRVLNQGRLPSDSLPYYQEMLLYKDFIDQVETRALDTLRMTIQRLIQDFEHQPGVNEVAEFEQGKQAKIDAFKRLLKLVNDKDNEIKPEITKKTLTSEDTKLIESQRSPSDIKQVVHNLIIADKELNAMFHTDESAKVNPLVNKFRENQLDELYKLIEIALLKKYPKNVDKKMLEERYAQLTNPNHGDPKGASLRIIDAYLQQANSEALIKQAIEVVKPYYFQQIYSSLEEESKKVFEALQADATQEQVLSYYLFCLQNPDFLTSPTIHKLKMFNADRDQAELVEQLFPEKGKQAMFRHMIAAMGSNFDKKLPLDQQEKNLEEQVKAEYAGVRQFIEMQEKVEKEYQKATEQRVKSLEKMPAQETSEMEASLQAELEPQIYNETELAELMDFKIRSESLDDFIGTYAKSMSQMMSVSEMLHIYAYAINEFGMDMTHIFRQSILPDKYLSTNYLQQMQNLFGGNKNLDWTDVATYGAYLEGFYKSGFQTFYKDKHRFDTVERSQELLISEMKAQPASAEEYVRQQSVFEMFMNEKYNMNLIKTRSDDLRQELSDLSKLQNKLEQEKKDRHAIDRLMTKAPKEVQELVSSILSSSSKYLNLKQLRQQLEQNKFEEVNANTIIDKDLLLQDIASGKLVQDFMKNYQQTPLDVVSLAQTKSMVQNSEQFSKDLKVPVLTVLDHVEQNLRYVPNERRKEITLGDYMRRHHYINSSSLTEFSNDILKNIISRTLGEKTDLSKLDNIDWEYAGYRTNPQQHIDENRRVEQLNQKGQTAFSQSQIDQYVDKIINKQEIDQHKKIYTTYNYELNKFETYDPKNAAFNEVIKEALDYCQIKSDFLPVRDYFENLILKMYSSTEFDQSHLERVIQKYTEMRINDCMMTPGFRDKVNSDNGHIFMKVLKENIVDELKLTAEPKLQEINFQFEMSPPDSNKVSVEGKYNMSDVNNTEAIGYNNLEERFANISENRDKAHENIFDKLLAEYFLQKRGQYVKSKELLNDLNEIFVKKGFDESHPAHTKDPQQQNINQIPMDAESNIAFQQAKQDIDKDVQRNIMPSTFNSMMELDIATAQQLHGGRNGLHGDLKQAIPDEFLHIPEYFQIFDVRKPAKKWIEDRLELLLIEVFDVRKNVEKTLSRQELVAYDKMLTNFLQKEVLLPRLRSEVQADFNELYQISQLHEMKEENEYNDLMQHTKTNNDQPKENRSIKNEDALYKFMAYSGMLEKSRRENLNKLRKDDMAAFSMDTFDEFYKRQLYNDSKRDPRPVNPEDFQQKRISGEPKFMTYSEREANYFKEFELYKENKKEQQDRTRVFYVLESFFAKSRQDPNPMNKAQQAIEEYFADTENTFFYDKNKLQ